MKNNPAKDNSKAKQPCCGGINTQIQYEEPESDGTVTSGGLEIPRVNTRWGSAERMGEAMVRLGFKRMGYAVEPGVYAVNTPDENSPVFVSANYKLSFDVLKRELKGINSWILAVDTKGVNVWCSAGKGTFSAEEVSKEILRSNLGRLVKHDTVILPQLSAPGVAAHKVKELCGYKAVFGPVEAYDIKYFLDNNMKTDEKMREVSFNAGRRLEVSWLELILAMDKLFWPMIAVIVLSGIGSRGFVLYDAVYRGMFYLYAALTGMISGSVLFSLLLPVLPGRYFSVKGLYAGITGAVFFVLFSGVLSGPYMALHLPAAVLIITAVSSFAAMNYTGCSTFTSISGVKTEVKNSIPFIIAGGVISLLLIITEMIIRVTA
ncbi:MAG: acetyl-CoA synthase subunit gamma [Candidatus Goldbacteria bacterium]|nr:acetyl-CoA synthase subunit gamma [Candidatus Goldiibacteriota bacterium]